MEIQLTREAFEAGKVFRSRFSYPEHGNSFLRYRFIAGGKIIVHQQSDQIGNNTWHLLDNSYIMHTDEFFSDSDSSRRKFEYFILHECDNDSDPIKIHYSNAKW